MSFKLKTILGIAFIESILLVILILSVLNFLKTSHENEINHHTHSTAYLFASMIKNAVISSDLASLNTFVEEILTNKDIAYVRIFNDQLILAESGDSNVLKQPFIADNSLDDVTDSIYDVQAVIKEQDYHFATIQIGFSIKRIQSVLSDTKKWSIIIALIEIILVGIFSFVLGIWLTRQLTSLKKASKDIQEHGPGVQIEIKGNDEIADVSKAFNDMSYSLVQSYDEMEYNNLAYKQMAKLANKNAAFTEAIISASMDAIITINKTGQIIEFNKIAEQIFGYKRKEIINQNIAPFIIPEIHRKAHIQGIQHYHNSGEGPVLNQKIQLNALHKNGHEFPIEISISDIKIADEVFFTAYIKDITEEVKNKQELLLSATAFEANEAIFITDNKHQILRANSAFTKITGFSQDEIIGQKPKILQSNRHDTSFYNAIFERLRTHNFWEGEIYNKRKNGEIYPEWLTISAVNNEQGQLTNYVAHFIDISRRKKHEEELTQAKQDAEKASQAKSQFLATMTHEIRTPLNAVIGILNILKDEGECKTQTTYLDTAETAATSLLSIINDILDFSKIEAGKMQLSNSSFSLKDLSKNLINLFKEKAKQQNINLALKLDESIPEYFIGDSDKLKQVLINLLNNAIKFTHQGEVSLEVKLLQQQEKHCQLEFTIHDTGIGIAEDKIPVLFNDFSQVEQASTRKYEGTGLGLAISQKLIQLMGSQIAVKSVLDQGSQFIFELRLLIDSNPEQSNEQDQVDIKPGNAHILLVEDNEANVIVAQTILQKQGYQVDVAQNGLIAVDKVVEKVNHDLTYDLVLMDLMMPEMDGMTALKEIRKINSDKLADLPILAMTANVNEENIQKCLQNGFDGFIPKPFKKKELFKEIQQHLSIQKDLSIPKHLSLNAENSSSNEKLHSNTKPSENDSLELLERSILNEAILERAILEQLAEDTSPDIIPKMIKVFIEENERRLLQIEQALTNKDADAIGDHVHSLKSSAGTYGAKALEKLSIDIDRDYKNKNYSQVLTQGDSLPNLIRDTMEKYKLFKL